MSIRGDTTGASGPLIMWIPSFNALRAHMNQLSKCISCNLYYPPFIFLVLEIVSYYCRMVLETLTDLQYMSKIS